MSDLSLYDYQKRLLESVVRAFKRGSRDVLLHAPCGAGKTLLGKAFAADVMFLRMAGLPHQISYLLDGSKVTIEFHTLFSLLEDGLMIEIAFSLALFTILYISACSLLGSFPINTVLVISEQ